MSTQALESTFSNIIPPDDATAGRLKVISRAKQFADGIQQLVVNSPESYIVAGETLKTVKGIRAELEAACRPEIDARHKAHKDALKQFNDGDGPLATIENTLKRALLSWDQEQERLRRKEQERLQAIADAEAKRQAEEARLQAAIDAEEAGDTEGSKAILEAPPAPVMAPPVVLATTTPKVSGLSTRQNWKFQIVDASLIPREYLVPDEKKIGGVVRALKDQTKIPGIKVYPEDVLSAGR